MGYTGDSFKKQYDKNGKLIDPEDIIDEYGNAKN